MNETGGVPPGNAKGNTTWSIKRSAPKPELKLTPGKGLQDLTCSVEDLVEQVVKTNKVLLASLNAALMFYMQPIPERHSDNLAACDLD